MSAPLVILGCGYVGSRLARAALAAGRVVRVCARSTGRLAPLGELGAHIKYFDAALPKQFGPAITGLPGATVVYSLPPIGALPPGQAMAGALQGAYGAGASTLIYFSSAGLYGPLPDDDPWVDEDTPIATDDGPMTSVRADEAAIEAFPADRLRSIILRLAPIYGPGRGVRERLRKGKYQILDDGEHVTSRIHVDDAVRIVLAADERAASGSKFLVADDEPTTQGAYAAWLCTRLGLEPPPSRRLYEPGGQQVAHRNRKIRNTRLKTALAIELLYPSFREGEAAIDAAEKRAE